MFKRLFTAHPASVEESYGQHFIVAGGFALAMLFGGLRVLIHAFIPGFFINAGSSTVKRLNAIMVTQRSAKRGATSEMNSIEYII
ncbi:MAG: DUF6356 family protein [Sphingorhabdus sp.]